MRLRLVPCAIAATVPIEHGHTTIPLVFADPDAGRSPRSAASNASTVSEPATASGVRLAQHNETNSFIFGFESPAQIVGQRSPARERYLRSDRLITVVVGNPGAFERPLSTLGTVTTMRLEEIRR